MFKNYSLLAYLMIASAVIGFSAPSVAEQPLGQFGVWEAFTEREGKSRLCFMASEATKARGNYKKRGKTYVMVTHRPPDNTQRDLLLLPTTASKSCDCQRHLLC